MRSPMSGQRIPIFRKLGSEWLGYRKQKNRITANAKTVLNNHANLLRCMNTYTDREVGDSKILEIGCGQKALQLAVFKADGATAIGIDVEVPTFQMSPKVWLEAARRNGWERAIKSLARHLLLDRKYYSEMSRLYGKDISTSGLDVRVMDATKLEFEDDTFDFIYSVAVMEHVDNVRAAIKEANRVLKPTGAAYVDVHLYPSIGGSHCPEWLDPEDAPSETVPPWDHLRENKYPANTYLNKLKIDDYRAICGSEMDIAAEHKWVMGERHLTQEIEEELTAKGFTREDLVTSNVTFILKKHLPT